MFITPFMSGIYIHIPFCKKACHYCNFHFSTQIDQVDAFVEALLREMKLRKNYVDKKVDTLYLGGGTPSLLTESHLATILEGVYGNFRMSDTFEFTLEANPDDISIAKTAMWQTKGINRLSIGVQSFQENALSWMNRAHTAQQAHDAIKIAKEVGINNISIDLIYGTPLLTDEALFADLAFVKQYQIPHISCYALTVEEKTSLHHLIKTKKIANIDTDKQARHFEIVVNQLTHYGFDHYEIANFSLPGFRGKHNSSYWKGTPYLGLGPAAHSFNKVSRQWNIANNNLYIKALQENRLDFEIEMLDLVTQYNEFIMISLRLQEGFSLQEIEMLFGTNFVEHTKKISTQFVTDGKMVATSKGYTITKKARFLADGIASDFFIIP